MATLSAKVSVSIAFRAETLTRQASSIVTRSPQLLLICGAPVAPLLTDFDGQVGPIPAKRFPKIQGHPTIRRVDIPANQQREVVVGHGLRPCWTVHHPDRELAADGVEAQHVAGGPAVAQPSAGRRKWSGTPVAGLLGAQSALVFPVAITPTFSVMTSNEVLLVIRTTQRSGERPRLI